MYEESSDEEEEIKPKPKSKLSTTERINNLKSKMNKVKKEPQKKEPEKISKLEYMKNLGFY